MLFSPAMVRDFTNVIECPQNGALTALAVNGNRIECRGFPAAVCNFGGFGGIVRKQLYSRKAASLRSIVAIYLVPPLFQFVQLFHNVHRFCQAQAVFKQTSCCLNPCRSRRFPVFHDLPQAGKRRTQSLFCLNGRFFQKLCNSFLISRLELRFIKISFQGRKPDTCFLCRLRLCGLRQKSCKRPRLFLCQCKSPLP